LQTERTRKEQALERVARLDGLADGAAWLTPHSLLALVNRIAEAGIFWLSARTKVDGWFTVSDSAYTLFREEFKLPLLAPELAAPTLLDSATRRGADALGFGSDYGTLAPGKRAALVAVAVPPVERDVEEYLVSGVSAAAIRRVA